MLRLKVFLRYWPKPQWSFYSCTRIIWVVVPPDVNGMTWRSWLIWAIFYLGFVGGDVHGMLVSSVFQTQVAGVELLCIVTEHFAQCLRNFGSSLTSCLRAPHLWTSFKSAPAVLSSPFIMAVLAMQCCLQLELSQQHQYPGSMSSNFWFQNLEDDAHSICVFERKREHSTNAQFGPVEIILI